MPIDSEIPPALTAGVLSGGPTLVISGPSANYHSKKGRLSKTAKSCHVVHTTSATKQMHGLYHPVPRRNAQSSREQNKLVGHASPCLAQIAGEQACNRTSNIPAPTSWQDRHSRRFWLHDPTRLSPLFTSPG